MSDITYIGRFAPSPSGDLHFGSLVTAVASFLRAKQHNNGIWLVRIDDLDPPRELAGASKAILNTLTAHGLEWDQPPLYQSTRTSAYDHAFTRLNQAGLTYPCTCTRKQIKQAGEYYSGSCRGKKLAENNCSYRFLNSNPIFTYQDKLLGSVSGVQQASSEDFIVKRKDGLFAYHLAAVVDDIHQQITEVVRGADLLQPTICQLALYHAFDATPPAFLHVPVIVSRSGLKLSKQNRARPLNHSQATANLVQAIQTLGLNLPLSLQKAKVDEVLDYAIENWRLSSVAKVTELTQPE